MKFDLNDALFLLAALALGGFGTFSEWRWPAWALAAGLVVIVVARLVRSRNVEVPLPEPTTSLNVFGAKDLNVSDYQTDADQFAHFQDVERVKLQKIRHSRRRR